MFKGSRVKSLRERRGISSSDFPYQLHEKTGVKLSRVALDNIEKGKSDPKASKVFAICQFFNKELEFFFKK